MSLRSIALFAIATGFASVANAVSGSGTTTRYWDCCKPSCSWSGKGVAKPVNQCSASNSPLTQGDDTQASGCNSGGTAYACADQTPFLPTPDSLVAYGYAAANIAGLVETQQCCSCVELTFTDAVLGAAKKKMVVQITNTGSDLAVNQFDLAFPGGGVGLFNACVTEYGSFPLGAQYGGITDPALCDQYPAALQAGCKFRFGWFQGADNPSVTYEQVVCPAAITAITGCTRSDEAGLPVADSPAAAASSAAPIAASSSSSAIAADVATSSSAYVAPAEISSTYVAPVASSSALSSYVASTTAATSSTSVPAVETASTYAVPSSSTAASASAPTTYITETTTASYTSTAAPEATDVPDCEVQYITMSV